MQVTSKDPTLKVVSMTRFHFVAGLPKSGARQFTKLLGQNPKFCVSSDSPAERLVDALSNGADTSGLPFSDIDARTHAALLRSTLDAAHHARGIDSVVVDNNPKWLSHITTLGVIFPLSRFVILVREPERIAAEIAEDAGEAQSPTSLMSLTGEIGRPILQLQSALEGPAAARMLLIDYDRMLQDAEQVFQATYSFLREPMFKHDFRTLAGTAKAAVMPAAKQARRFWLPGGQAAARSQIPAQPIWRRNQSSAATMLLS